jgi:hypothetical protein
LHVLLGVLTGEDPAIEHVSDDGFKRREFALRVAVADRFAVVPPNRAECAVANGCAVADGVRLVL